MVADRLRLIYGRRGGRGWASERRHAVSMAPFAFRSVGVSDQLALGANLIRAMIDQVVVGDGLECGCIDVVRRPHGMAGVVDVETPAVIYDQHGEGIPQAGEYGAGFVGGHGIHRKSVMPTKVKGVTSCAGLAWLS